MIFSTRCPSWGFENTVVELPFAAGLVPVTPPRSLRRSPDQRWQSFSGSRVTVVGHCVMGHMGQESRKTTHFHLCPVMLNEAKNLEAEARTMRSRLSRWGQNNGCCRCCIVAKSLSPAVFEIMKKYQIMINNIWYKIAGKINKIPEFYTNFARKMADYIVPDNLACDKGTFAAEKGKEVGYTKKAGRKLGNQRG